MGYLCATCGGVGGLFETSHAHSDKDSCIAELKAEKAKVLLQLDEAKVLLKRFLDAGPEEEYEVILCKLSEDVEEFFSGKPETRNCECVWMDCGPVGTERDRSVPCPVHDKKKVN